MILFDVNGHIGESARHDAEFPTAIDLLRRMDSLGVQRSLVWHLGARDVNPTWGNNRLLEDLAAVPAAHGRLIPAFVIGNSILHERGGMQRLKSAMKENNVRALRLFPRHLNHSLAEMEPLIREVAAFRPALFVDCRSLEFSTDLSNLAEAFPELAFVYTHASWPQVGAMFDLLERHPNLLADTSWLHVCGTLEKIVRDFGAQRAVFGLGHKTNHGASILDLSDATISAEVKAQVGHRNLENLLGLQSLVAPASISNQKGGLWNALLAGKPSPIEIFDVHGHLGPWGTWMLGTQQIQDQMEDIVPRMDRLGIKAMIVSGTHALMGEPVSGNRLLEEQAARWKDRFRGYLVFNPRYYEKLLPTFDDFFGREFFVGFKLLNSYWQVPVTDPRHEAVWQYANEHRLPILLHTWNDDFDHPSMLKEIVPRYPEATFILGHSGGTDEGRQGALRLALENQNVYLEWCGSFQMTEPFEELIKAVGSDRVVFGTDATLHSPAWELGRFLSQDLPDEMLIPILGANIRKILGRRK